MLKLEQHPGLEQVAQKLFIAESSPSRRVAVKNKCDLGGLLC
jgi:hypothetical protein